MASLFVVGGSSSNDDGSIGIPPHRRSLFDNHDDSNSEDSNEDDATPVTLNDYTHDDDDMMNEYIPTSMTNLSSQQTNPLLNKMVFSSVDSIGTQNHLDELIDNNALVKKIRKRSSQATNSDVVPELGNLDIEGRPAMYLGDEEEDDGAFEEEEPDDCFTIRKLDATQIMYAPKDSMPKLVEKYMLGDALGQGSYGKVKEALDANSLRRVAVKIMKRKKLKKIPNGEKNVAREISLLKKLKHPNVIELFDVYYNTEKQKLYVFMEFCSCGMMEMLEIAPGKKFPISQAQWYFRQLLVGMEYLHSQGILHRDIKPGNLLVALDGSLKISDFGVAEVLDIHNPTGMCTSSSGSPAFQCPEIVNGQESFNGFKVDMWAVGVTLYNMTTGGYPFEGENIYNLFENIAKGTYSIPSDVDDQLRSILSALICVDAGARLDVYQAQLHPWTRDSFLCLDDWIPVVANLRKNGCRGTSLIPALEKMYTAAFDEEPDTQLETSAESAEDSSPFDRSTLLFDSNPYPPMQYKGQGGLEGFKLRRRIVSARNISGLLSVNSQDGNLVT